MFTTGILAVALMLLTMSSLQAQLHVEASGEVGIGTTAPGAKLQIENASSSTTSLRINNNHTSTSTRYGIYNFTNSTTNNAFLYGIRNQHSSSDSYIYGIYNHLSHTNSSSTAYAGLYANMNYMYPRTNGTVIGNYAYTYRYSGNGSNYGLYSYIYNSQTSHTGTSYGLYTYVNSNGTGSKYGIYANVPTGTNQYAGYFNGDVTVTGTFTNSSDAYLKENVSEIGNALDMVLQLSGKSYTYKQDNDAINLPQGTQFGFLAQELEQVMPSLVKEVQNPGETKMKAAEGETSTNKNGETAMVPEEGETQDYKAVNYIGVIPVLVEAIKDQQKLIESQRKQIEAQNRRIESLENKLR